VSVLVAANLVATALRFLLYRTWVFGHGDHIKPAETLTTIQPDGSIH
jgi:hypothetical protein